MVSKILLAELESLKVKAMNLKDSLQETLEENNKKDTEYAELKKQYQNEICKLAKEQNCLDQKLTALENQITEYEIKLKDSFVEQGKVEAEFNEYTFELSKIKEDIRQFDYTNNKKIDKLMEEIRIAKEKLKEQCQLEKQLEKNFSATLKNKKNEAETKIAYVRKIFEGRFEKLDEKYKNITSPLLHRLECLDNDIRIAEAELEQKPKEVEALKEECMQLEKRYETVVEERLLDESALSADALFKGLKYFKHRPEALTNDAILGVLIIRANLQWIFERLHNNHSFSNQLESLIKQCNDIINLNRTESSPILRKTLWNSVAEDLRWGSLNTENHKYMLPKFDSCQSIDSYFMKGTPEDSDFCLNELVNSDCKVSNKCWFSETNKMNYSGYKTSHRFLYFFIATQLKCEKKNPDKFASTRMLKRNLCQQMLSEAKALFEEPHFALTRDLFLEHVALCGLEGYKDFASYAWRKDVRNWQNSEGCFGYDVDFPPCQINAIQKDHKSRVKRTDTVIDGCHTHITAVALSSLAFFLRCTLNATFNLPRGFPIF